MQGFEMSNTNLQERTEQLAQKINWFDQLMHKYADITASLNIVPPAEAGSMALSAKQIIEKVSEQQKDAVNLRIGIIGRVKAGKSSLLNALLFEGKDVLPKAATPMTASLTVLRYAESAYAEVEFFSREDRAELAKAAEEYDQRFQSLLEEKRQQFESRPKRPGALAPVFDENRQKEQIRRKLNTEAPHLDGAKALYEEIKSNSHRMPDASVQRVEAHSVEALQEKLNDYVAAKGQFTAFTKCLNVYLPLPALQNLEVVDTPGVNDPIKSREARTMSELHKCHAAFVVSPAGQFLNDADLELMGRLSGHNGVEEVFLVASQVDLQLFGSERQRFEGRLPEVLQGVRQTLATHAEGNLKNQEGMQSGKGLQTLRKHLQERLTISSSVAHTLATKPEMAAQDQNIAHVKQLFEQHYASYFSTSENARIHYLDIAGIEKVEGLLQDVRKRRDAIVQRNILAFLEAQDELHAKRVQYAPQVIEKSKRQLETFSKTDLSKQIESIRKKSAQCVRVVEAAVGSKARETADLLRSQMRDEVKLLFTRMRSEASSAKGTETETYTVNSSGVISWFARKLGLGGTERRSRTVNTLNATEIRNAVEALNMALEDCLQKPVKKINRNFRHALEGAIITELRSKKVVDDSELDFTILAQSCEKTISKLARDFVEPKVPGIPKSLAQNGTLRGSRADEYYEEAMQYVSNINDFASRTAKETTEKFEQDITNAKIGSGLFEQLDERLQSLEKQVSDKEAVIRRYNDLLNELQGA
ncbi:hypothetical protein EII18_07740 [Comamonadaceae bacterium OH3737_COT-264]|nr:hypothetical protein EII18_07740 [Comamonadaceae bacterium OH3737_COT-264]